MGINLPVIWAVIILFGLMMYIIMDGFDLGIGLLYPFFKSEQERDVMMNSVAPVWDGNETWLILGGAGLMAAFPLAYSIILSALYLPLIMMLIGLVLRGVAFEFRFKSRDHERHLWDKAFFVGSFIASFFQGVALGLYLQGLQAPSADSGSTLLDWISPFSIFTGIGVVFTYSLLGSTWLIMKTEGQLQLQAYQVTKKLAGLLLVCILIVTLWTPLMDPNIGRLWLSYPNILMFMPVPILVMVLAKFLIGSLNQGRQRMPFLCTLGLVILGFLGLSISIWPNVIPFWLTIQEASSPPQSQGFALVGALLIIPVILVYTAWSYYVFRGKVRPGEMYH
jgi:cytochrome d ubiquinol oxidase subunit II